ncbi:MAG: tautomerase family protein [Candidatus Cloacimonetes bacterium]|nr:tautomerase family protein [Candidatus Cloacimonadota bacterium]
MPNITIEGPAIKELDTKRRFAKELTEAAVRAYGLPKGIIVVLIKENSPENVSVGGQLILDRLKQKSEK